MKGKEEYMPLTLDIIIVNRNSEKMLHECLSSISLADKNNFSLLTVTVVDDLSIDDSLSGIEKLDLPLKIIRNTVRMGYGASCNVGVKSCVSDVLLFLNSDAILGKDSLTIPLSYLSKKENDNTGILGIKQIDSSGKVMKNCSRFPSAKMFLLATLGLTKIFPATFKGSRMSDWDHSATREVDQVIGAVMFMRRRIFNEINGYDERFFVYYEDMDLSYRTKIHGYNSVYLASVCAHHKGGGTARKIWAESLFFNRRSRIIYAFKHLGLLPALGVTLNTLVLEPTVRLFRSLIMMSYAEFVASLKYVAMLWLNLPLLIFNKTRNNWPG